MGGRVGSHLAGGFGDEPGRTGDELAGLVYLGYPLVPLGKSEPRPVGHLGQIDVPQLFVAGTRDRLSPPPAILEVAARLPRATVHVIDDADHGFHVPKRTGRTDADVLQELIGLVSAAAS
jgi:predicted alpha/beta-hydrolase family hydrolase